MKKFTTLALAGLVATSVYGQQPKKQMFVSGPEQYTTAHNVKNAMIFSDVNNHAITQATLLQTKSAPAANGKIAAVSPTMLGSATNVFTILRQEQNQVFADDGLDIVGFTHRNNASVFGGASGNMRYDVSIDGGMTFTNDIGPLNPTITLPSRYPNAAIYNPANNTNPLNSEIVMLTPTLGTPSWDGTFAINAPMTMGTGVMEHYDFQATTSLLPGGLCEGMSGEFWAVDFASTDKTNADGPINLYKGTRNGQGDVQWTVSTPISPNHVLSGGTPTAIGPNISFSPDGTVGWVAFLGDLVGGVDSSIVPVFSKTTDNGATWSTPVEYNLNTESWVADTLMTFFGDSLGAPISNGIATCAFDYDLTVDGDGNPHLAVVVGTLGTGQAYSLASGIAKFMADIYSNDGGATWKIAYISPVLAFRTAAFQGTGTSVTMDNSCQISRSADGQFIFYAWSDSDTATVTGNMNGIGVGVSTNSAPNLRVAGMNTATGEQSYPKLVTDLDNLWEGRALFPTIAPTAIETTPGCFKLPIVMAEMPTGSPTDPANFWYFGNDASICASSMCMPSSMQLFWTAFGHTGATPPCLVGVKNNVESNVVLGNAYPNPTANSAVIGFELPAASSIVIDVMNIYGQQVAVLANGDFNAGAHKVVLNTEKLASGVYFYNLRTNEQVLSKKLVVSK